MVKYMVISANNSFCCVGLDNGHCVRVLKMETNFEFKTIPLIFIKEKWDIKNNTVRYIDLDDDRFLHLIYWMVNGFNDGEIKITIRETIPRGRTFTRNIRDISIYDGWMIITWNEK